MAKEVKIELDKERTLKAGFHYICGLPMIAKKNGVNLDEIDEEDLESMIPIQLIALLRHEDRTLTYDKAVELIELSFEAHSPEYVFSKISEAVEGLKGAEQLPSEE